MSTLQKILLTISITLVIGAGWYETHKTWCLEKEKLAREQRVEQGLQQTAALKQERDRAVAQLEAARQQLELTRRDIEQAERLRRELSALREQVHAGPQAKTVQGESATAAALLSLSERVGLLKQQLARTPERSIPELKLANDSDWLEAAAAVKTGEEADLRKALSHLRTLAKEKLAPAFGAALRRYIQEHDGVLPGDMMELQPYFESPVDDVILQRYQVAAGKRLSDLKPGQTAIQERSRADDADSLMFIDPDRYYRQSPPQVVQGPDGIRTSIQVQSISLPK